MHSNVIWNWNGLVKSDGLSSTSTLVTLIGAMGAEKKGEGERFEERGEEKERVGSIWREIFLKCFR